jgi:hypothetical protein
MVRHQTWKSLRTSQQLSCSCSRHLSWMCCWMSWTLLGWRQPSSLEVLCTLFHHPLGCQQERPWKDSENLSWDQPQAPQVYIFGQNKQNSGISPTGWNFFRIEFCELRGERRQKLTASMRTVRFRIVFLWKSVGSHSQLYIKTRILGISRSGDVTVPTKDGHFGPNLKIPNVVRLFALRANKCVNKCTKNSSDLKRARRVDASSIF